MPVTHNGETHTHGFYRWKLFVFGVDVTDDLGAISIPRSDARQPGSATFTLANPFHRYTTTPGDLQLLYQDIPAGYEALKKGTSTESDAVDIAQGNAQNHFYDPTKQLFLQAKVGEKQTLVLGGTGKDHEGEIVTQLRWRFAAGLPIIHPGDPVTFFELEPTTLRWHWGFCGKVRMATPERDPSGRAVVTLTCVDALGPLEQARTSFNPSILSASVISTGRDLVSQLWYADGYSGISLPEYIGKLVFGDRTAVLNDPSTKEIFSTLEGTDAAKVKRYGAYAEKPTEEDLVITAVGSYDAEESAIVYLGDTPESDSAIQGYNPIDGTPVELPLKSKYPLESWQYLLDWEVDAADLQRLARFSEEASAAAQLDIDSATDPATNTIDQYKLIECLGRNPQRYPVDRGRILQLYPAALKQGGDKNVLLKDIIQGPGFQTEFKSRFAVIYDVLQRIDHVMYATPKGDVVIEMPLMHFDEDRWGRYSDVYTYTNQDNAGKTEGLDITRMVSVMTASPAIVRGERDLGTYESLDIEPPEVAVSHALVAQFGIRIEKAPIRVFVGSKEAAAAYAQSQLTKLNGELDTADLEIFPRLGLGPNRPMFDLPNGSIGTIRSVNWGLQWSGSASMRLSLNHIRRWQGGVRSDGLPLFEPIDGVGKENEGYNWAVIMGDPSSGATAPNKPAEKPHPTEAAQTRTGKLFQVRGHDHDHDHDHELRSIGNGQQVAAAMAADFERMRLAAQAAGHTLTATSGERTFARQDRLYREHLANLAALARGEPKPFPGVLFAVPPNPAHGDHQHRGAVDINLRGLGTDSPLYRWVLEHGAEYGFLAGRVRGDPVHLLYRPNNDGYRSGDD